MLDFTTKYNHVNSRWTREQEDLVKRLWADGKSAKQIAIELDCGITRNAVIGKVHRMGLSKRERAPAKPKNRRAESFVHKINSGWTPKKAPTIPLPSVEPPEFRGLTFAQLEPYHCRYPRGDGPFLFCGQPIERGSYCAHCNQITHWIVTEREANRMNWWV
jgi:GcrA cell cycle regulator